MNDSVDQRGIAHLLDLAREFGGLDFPVGRRSGIERPIQAAMERVHARSIGELVTILSAPRNVDELERFVASLTIGETHFFRNHPQIDAIRRVILPEIIERKRASRDIRIWSAGCSTGEEPYSLAIMIDTLLADHPDWNISILATDLNGVALDRAREGRYGEWSFRGVPDHIRSRYFAQDGRRYVLDQRIREMVRFSFLNLVDDGYPTPGSGTADVDLILCRNVLIYFRPDTIDAVVTRLERSLAPGGWLVAGHAESPMPIFRRLFEAEEQPMAVVYRKRIATATPAPAPTFTTFPMPDWPGPRHRSTPEWTAPPVVEPSIAAGSTMPTVPPAMFVLPSVPEPAGVRSRAGGAPGDLADVERAVQLFAEGARESALSILHRAAEAAPRDPVPLIVAARLLAGAVQYEAAEHVVRMAIARRPDVAEAHYVHALVLEGLSRPSDAMEALRRTCYLDPGFALAYFSLASLLDAAGQTDRARRALDRVVELLADHDDESVIDSHERLTAGRLRDMTTIRRELLHDEVNV